MVLLLSAFLGSRINKIKTNSLITSLLFDLLRRRRSYNCFHLPWPVDLRGLPMRFFLHRSLMVTARCRARLWFSALAVVAILYRLWLSPVDFVRIASGIPYVDRPFLFF